MSIYRILGLFTALLIALSRAHVHVALAGIPFSVPVLGIIVFTFVTGLLAMVALLAFKIARDWTGWRGCLYAGRTA